MYDSVEKISTGWYFYWASFYNKKMNTEDILI